MDDGGDGRGTAMKVKIRECPLNFSGPFPVVMSFSIINCESEPRVMVITFRKRLIFMTVCTAVTSQ